MKRPHLPHLILHRTSPKTKAETASPVPQGESQHTSLKERTIKLGRKLSFIARPTPKQAHQLQTQSDDSQLEQVQEESVDSMGPLREMELPTARSIFRSFSQRGQSHNRSLSATLGRSKTSVSGSSKFTRGLRRFQRRTTGAGLQEEDPKGLIGKPMPSLPPLAFNSPSGAEGTSRSNSTSSRHGRANSDPQIYFTPLEALTANKLDDLEPWLGVLVAKPKNGEVDFGLPGPRRHSKARLSAEVIEEVSRRSALSMGSVYSAGSGDDALLMPTAGPSTEVIRSPLPSPSPIPPSHRPSVPVDVDVTLSSISTDFDAPLEAIGTESDEELEEDEDPFIYDRYYQPSHQHTPSKSTGGSSSRSVTPPLTRSQSPLTPKSSFTHAHSDHTHLTPLTPVTPSPRYRPPSPFPFKSQPLPDAPMSSEEDLVSNSSSSSKASAGHRTALKESYNILPDLPAFSIQSEQSTLLPRSQPPSCLLPATPPPPRPLRLRPVGPSPTTSPDPSPIRLSPRRGNTHDGHTNLGVSSSSSSFKAPRERIKSLRRIASASNAPTRGTGIANIGIGALAGGPKIPADSPLLMRKLSYQPGSGSGGTSSTSLPTHGLLASANNSTSTLSVPVTKNNTNNGNGNYTPTHTHTPSSSALGLQLPLKQRLPSSSNAGDSPSSSTGPGFQTYGSSSCESLVGSTGHSNSNSYSTRGPYDDQNEGLSPAGTRGSRKVVQIRWGYI